MKNNLKAQLIRLGSQNPDLQKHLKPVLDAITTGKTASQTKEASSYGQLFEGMFTRGTPESVLVGKNLRMSHSRYSIFLEELPVKGKKKCRYTHVNTHYLSNVNHMNEFIPDNILLLAKVGKSDSYDSALRKLEKALLDSFEKAQREYPPLREKKLNLPNSEFLNFSEGDTYYLNVPPSDTDPITALGKDFAVNSQWTSWQSFSPDSNLQEHDPSYGKMVSTSPTAARKMFKLLSADPDALKNVSWSRFDEWLKKNKVRYEYQASAWR